MAVAVVDTNRLSRLVVPSLPAPMCRARDATCRDALANLGCVGPVYLGYPVEIAKKIVEVVVKIRSMWPGG